MSNATDTYLTTHEQELYDLGDQLFLHPELGFKEWETGRIIRAFCKAHELPIHQEYALTGFSVRIGSGEPHIGLIAELDAIPVAGHPCANPETNAAHACGHSTQCAIMLGALAALKDSLKSEQGTVTLYFTPAEEFTDMEYRNSLVKEGKVRYCSGKQNMLAERIFEEEDLLIHLHAMTNPVYQYSIGSVLSGFVYKKITFLGKASHAAALPHLGINALNECTLFLNALNMLRETFQEEDVVRLHGMITKGGTTVNSIPEEVVYECYVRSVNPEVIQEVNDKVNRAAIHCANALGGEVRIEDTPGYLPLHQSKELNEVIHRSILKYAREEDILYGEISAAAGDVGDICMFKPIIQYGYNGFTGAIHGADLAIVNKEQVYVTQARIVADAVETLLSEPDTVARIKDSFQPKMSYEEYIRYLSGKRKD
ncbi:MAG: amidohydrolase [Solobacterium sp.]|nr:amidohydrolase [Solobacterium sp.]